MKRALSSGHGVLEPEGLENCADNHEEKIPPNPNRNTQKKLRAEVFTISVDENNKKTACCNKCSKVIKMANGNTTGMKRHLENVHPEIFLEIYPADVAKKKNESKGREPFSPEKFQNLLIEWTAAKYLPFCFFVDERTQNLFEYLNPMATVPKRDLCRSLILERFTTTQKAVMEILRENPSKISFTVDAWTSVSNKSFYGITGHFIDDQWNIQSLVIDFVPSNGCHSGKSIARIFHSALKKHGLLDKVQGITLDNASANTKFLKELVPLMLEDGIDFDPINQHFRCFAHVINLAVNDMLRVVQSNIDEEDDDKDEEEESDDEGEVLPADGTRVLSKLKSVFKKIKYSEQWTNKLKACCETTNTKMLSPNLGVATRWNSTCEMVQTAIEMKEALNLLCGNNMELKGFSVSDNEWALLSELLKYLRYFKVMSTALSGDHYASLPLVVIGINMILDKLDSCLQLSAENRSLKSINGIISHAVAASRKKLIKHYSKANWIYCAVLVLDPRHKTETFQKTVWGKEMADESIRQFERVYRCQYFDCTALKDPGLPTSRIANAFSAACGSSIDDDDSLDLNSLFESSYSDVAEPSTGDWRKEINGYLNLPRATKDDNILTWWRQHEQRLPILARMAKDFLSIQATSVSVERFFSKASLVIRKHRNRLNYESARSLLCLNSWVTCTLSPLIGAKTAIIERSAKEKRQVQ